MKGRVPTSELRKINQLLATGHIIKTLNTKDNTIKIYFSKRLAAKSLGIDRVTLSKYINNNKLLKGIFLITK